MMDAAVTLTEEELAAALVRVKSYILDGVLWPDNFWQLSATQKKIVECDARVRRVRDSSAIHYGKFMGYTQTRPMKTKLDLSGLDNKRRASGEKDGDE